MGKKGIVHIPFVIILAVALLVVIVGGDFFKDRVNEIVTSLPIPTSTPEATASPSPTPSPTLKPATPKPTTAPAPVGTPKPTTAPISGPPGSGYSRLNVATARGNFTADVVSIDMGGVRMITDTANDNDCATNCPTIPLADYISRNGGFAGINGTYFCPADYADCASKVNSFDFPVYNTRLGKWINGGNLFWNGRSIMYFDGGGMHFLRNANSFGGGLTAGIVNHPGLVEGGNVIADQFSLSGGQMTKGSKSGIGTRGNVVYLVVGRNVDMLDFAHVFKSLGADYALNLDGGGSIALWFGGYKAGPGRNLPNAVIFAR